jgi:hypothetical protein
LLGVAIMPETANNEGAAKPRRRYVWPWFVLAAIVLGIILAVLWMSQEIARTRRIRDANSPSASQP